jgi:hypothetical protein
MFSMDLFQLVFGLLGFAILGEAFPTGLELSESSIDHAGRE